MKSSSYIILANAESWFQQKYFVTYKFIYKITKKKKQKKNKVIIL